MAPQMAPRGSPPIEGGPALECCFSHEAYPHMSRIRAARQARGWTQNELARKSGVSARTIHAVENGKSCRQATKRLLLNALGVPWDLRHEYFTTDMRSVHPTPLDEAQSA